MSLRVHVAKEAHAATLGPAVSLEFMSPKRMHEAARGEIERGRGGECEKRMELGVAPPDPRFLLTRSAGGARAARRRRDGAAVRAAAARWRRCAQAAALDLI